MLALDDLRQRLQVRPDFGRFATQSILDPALPSKSFRRGTLVELYGQGTALATIIARESLREGGSLVVVDAANRFYPPAAAALGIDLERMIVLRGEPDWLVNQALSCPAIDAVLCWPQKLDGKMFRRWQLAAERGGGVGLLVRPASARGSPSWADVQIVVEQATTRWRVDIQGRSVEFAIEEGRIDDSRHSTAESRPHQA
jgi:protein ImuA